MSDEQQKQPPERVQAPLDDDRRKELAFVADQAVRRALGAFQGQMVPKTVGYYESPAIMDLMKALVKAQKSFSVPKKTKTVEVKKAGVLQYTYTYADLAAIREACVGALLNQGLAYIQPIEEDDKGDLYLITKLVHADSGQFISTRLPLCHKAKDPQVVGSALTYMRRYGLSSLLGIATEDDDDGSREAAMSGADRTGHPVQDIPGRFNYRHDDEILWTTVGKVETKRIRAMNQADLKMAEARILKRGKQYKQQGDAARVADARRDLDLVRAALKVLNDPDFGEGTKPNAGTTNGLPEEAPGEEEADGMGSVPGRGDVLPGEAEGEERPPEEMAGVDSTDGEDQAPATPAEPEGTVGDDWGDDQQTAAEDADTFDDGKPDDQGGVLGDQGQGEPAPGPEGTPSPDDVPSASDEPAGADEPSKPEPAGGLPGQPSGPGTGKPAGKAQSYLSDPRRNDRVPDEPATLGLAERYKVNALKGLSSIDQTHLAELNDGEVQGMVLNCQELFSQHADALTKLNQSRPEAERQPPLTGPWVAYVWYPYHEENKLTRKDARKLAKVAIAHHHLGTRHDERRAARIGPDGLKREKDAIEALKGAFQPQSGKA